MSNTLSALVYVRFFDTMAHNDPFRRLFEDIPHNINNISLWLVLIVK